MKPIVGFMKKGFCFAVTRSMFGVAIYATAQEVRVKRKPREEKAKMLKQKSIFYGCIGPFRLIKTLNHMLRCIYI